MFGWLPECWLCPLAICHGGSAISVTLPGSYACVVFFKFGLQPDLLRLAVSYLKANKYSGTPIDYVGHFLFAF